MEPDLDTVDALDDPNLLRCLDALVDTLVPPDDWPGGKDAGVVDYLRRQFTRDLRESEAVYKTALGLLDAESLAAYAKPFADLDLDKRTLLLSNLESGLSTQSWPFKPAWFISLAAGHAAEGFYADPGNGGNRDGVAWKMVGFEVRG